MAHYADTSQESPAEQDFWKEFCARAGKLFKTAPGLDLSFTVQGNEVFFNRKKKSITRATIMQAYRNAINITADSNIITGPKKLLVFGASYLYPVFIDMGLFSPPPPGYKPKVGRKPKITCPPQDERKPKIERKPKVGCPPKNERKPKIERTPKIERKPKIGRPPKVGRKPKDATKQD